MPLSLGELTVHQVRDGTFALDGGAMFGIVPRPLWEKQLPPDSRHRVTLALRLLLIVKGDRRVLVDTGIGDQWSDKQREQMALDRSTWNVDGELARAGLTCDDITDVVLTHLHFDHAGGTVRVVDGRPRLSFPNAMHVAQRRHWDWSKHSSEKDAGSFRPETFSLLEQSGRLTLLDGPGEFLPGVELFLSEGHTVALQLVRVRGGERSLVFCGDLLPTRAHLKPAWAMAYDLHPLTALEEKKALLAEAAEERTILFFEHDPSVAACTVRERDGQIALDEVIDL